MSWDQQSPLDAGAMAAGAFLQGQNAKKQLDLQNKQYQQQLDQQAAYQAAQEQMSQQQEKFYEAQYAPGQFKPKTTTGTYQQSHPGHPKGSQKIMTGAPEYVPGTGGIEWQRQQTAAATAAALSTERNTQSQLNQARIPLVQAQAEYWKTKPGMEEKKENDRLKIAAERANHAARGGKSAGMTEYQYQQLQLRAQEANARLQEQTNAMNAHAQDHADMMNMMAGQNQQPQNYSPTSFPAPAPINVYATPPGGGGQQPPQQPQMNTQQLITQSMNDLSNIPPGPGRKAYFNALPYTLQLRLRQQGVNP